MGRNTFDMRELKATGFQTTDRRHLEKAYEQALGFPPDDSETIDQLREKLWEVYPETRNVKPQVADNVTAIPKATVSDISDPKELRRLPNLSGNGKWEGRMRRVMYTRTTNAKYEDALPVRWEEAFIKLPHGQQIDIPYPFYHAIRAAVHVGFTTEIVDVKGAGVPRGTKQVEHTETSEPKYNVADLGDTPGTEHLPENYGDFFRQVARRTSMLKGVSRAMILKVHTILFGVTPITELVHVSDQDIRLKIAIALGPEFEQLMTDELYGTAVA